MNWSSLLVLARRARAARAPSLAGGGVRRLVLATAILAIAGLGCGSVAAPKQDAGGTGGVGATDSGPQGQGGAGAVGGANGSDGGADTGQSDGPLVLRSGGLGSTDRSAVSATFRLSEARLGLSYQRACGAQLCVTGGLRP